MGGTPALPGFRVQTRNRLPKVFHAMANFHRESNTADARHRFTVV